MNHFHNPFFLKEILFNKNVFMLFLELRSFVYKNLEFLFSPSVEAWKQNLIKNPNCELLHLTVS